MRSYLRWPDARDKLFAMSLKSLLLCLVCLPVWAQDADKTAMDAQAAELKALV